MEYEDLSEELKLGLFELCKDMIYSYWGIPAISSITLDEELPMESPGAVIDLLKNYNMSYNDIDKELLVLLFLEYGSDEFDVYLEKFKDSTGSVENDYLIIKKTSSLTRWDNYMVSKFGLDYGAPIERIKINRNEIFS